MSIKQHFLKLLVKTKFLMYLLKHLNYLFMYMYSTKTSHGFKKELLNNSTDKNLKRS